MGRDLKLRGVHVFQKVPNTNQYRLKEVNPYVRLSENGETLYIQNGIVFDGGGVPYEKAKIPAWFGPAVERLAPHALRECGYVKETARK